MRKNPLLPERRPNRFPGYDYRQPGAYFVTVVTFRRKQLFGRLVGQDILLSPIGKIVKDCWLAIAVENSHVDLDFFTIMPDHIHGIIWIRNYKRVPNDSENPHQTDHRTQSGSLGRIINSFKGACTRRVRMAFPLSKIVLWQRNYHDHIVRSDAELRRIQDYIRRNPIELFLKRRGLSHGRAPTKTHNFG
jgi:REP element-mobilizing transposase RayT